MTKKNKNYRGESPVLLTEETYDGRYHAEMFDDYASALGELTRMKEEADIDPTYHITDGFMGTDGTMHRVMPLDDALGMDGKVVWCVSHKCFLPKTYGQMDWINYFTTKDEAKRLFEERAELYRQLLSSDSRITFSSDDEQLLVLFRGNPVIYLDYLSAPVGEIQDMGFVTKDAIIHARR